MADEGATPTVPRSIGRYEVVGHLASGGMAEILLGRVVGPSGFERPVVIKRILRHLARQPRFVDMFLGEAKIVANIRHPNVVHVEELGVEDGELYLTMEYLEGESAAGVVRRLIAHGESLGYALAAHVVAEACAGLHAAHELTDKQGQKLKLVHRDVSPQNIVVTYAGGVKVLDFGIAKVEQGASRTEAGQVKGKFEYMSPEQCLGKPLDRRSDIFALGTVLYELSTCHRLFKRDAYFKVQRAICEEPIAPPSSVAADYPPSLERICMRALAKKVADRYETAAEMRRDLVIAVRDLAGDSVPEEALALLMQRIFPDRIQTKAEMLQRVRQGAASIPLPAAESDESVDIPMATATETVRGTETSTPGRARSPAGRRLRWIGAAVAAIGLGGLIVAAARREPPARGHTPTDTAPAETIGTQAAPSVSAPAPPPVGTVGIVVETAPPGARVFVDGVERGVTPFSMKAPKETKTSSLQIKKDGYVTAIQSFTPDADQRIVLTLTRSRQLRSRPGPSTARSAPSGFYLLP